MKICFRNASLLDMVQGMQIKENMQVWTEDGKISFVGTDASAELFLRENDVTFQRIVECKNNLLMPGFKNAHTHSAMTFLRSKADNLPLQEWLNHLVFPAEAKLSEKDIYALTKLGILEYLQSGITGICEMYLTPDSIAAACVDMGMRCTLTGGVNNFSQSVDDLKRWNKELNKMHELIRFVPGFHAEYTCDKSLLCKIAGLAEELKTPVFAHVSETRKEVEECIARYGMTPVAFLDSIGMFRYGGCGYHLVHLQEDDYEILKKRGVYAVTNPASNLKLASGIAPVSRMLKEGIPVAIGTDGPASNNALDFFREMYLVSALAKVREEDPSAVSGEEVLVMACKNGAYACATPDSDCIAPGKNADMVLIDLTQPNMRPLHNIVDNLVYAGSKINVKLTMVAGRILYEDGVFYTGTEQEEIYEEAECIANRILG